MTYSVIFSNRWHFMDWDLMQVSSHTNKLIGQMQQYRWLLVLLWHFLWWVACLPVFCFMWRREDSQPNKKLPSIHWYRMTVRSVQRQSFPNENLSGQSPSVSALLDQAEVGFVSMPPLPTQWLYNDCFLASGLTAWPLIAPSYYIRSHCVVGKSAHMPCQHWSNPWHYFNWQFMSRGHKRSFIT